MKRLIAAMMATLSAMSFGQRADYRATSFENPPFHTGSIVNQGPYPYDQGFWGANAYHATSNIVSTFAHSGSQSLQLNTAGSTSQFDQGFQYVNDAQIQYDSSTNTNKLVIQETYIWLAQTTDPSGDDDYAGLVIGYNGSGGGEADCVLGSHTGRLYVYSPSHPGGAIVLNNDPTMWSLASWPVGQLNAWNKLTQVLDYSSGNVPTQNLYLNDVGVNATAAGAANTLGTAGKISNVGFIQGGGRFALGNTQGTSAYVDDFTYAAVPEPSALAAFIFGAIVLICRRRRAHGCAWCSNGLRNVDKECK